MKKLTETTVAWLYNERLGRATRHEFVGVRPGRLPDTSGGACHFLLFACEETGDVRVWGVE